MATTLHLSTKETVKLENQLRTEVTAQLLEFQRNKEDLDALAVEQERIKGEIDKIFSKYDADGALQAGAKIEGFTVRKHVGERTKRLDKNKLVAQGVTMAMIEAATTTTPKKSYVKVMLPGEKAAEEGQ